MHLFYAVFSLEFFAMLSGLLNVFLAVRANQWTWFFGVVSVSLYLIIFLKVKLYADMTLQFILLYLQFYGWYQWQFGGQNRSKLRVTLGNWRIYIASFFATAGLFICIAYCLANYTDSSTVYMDAFVTAVSLTAQWMMSKKLIENWILWAVTDTVSIVLYLQKGLLMTAGLYAMFLLLCINGYQLWSKNLNN